MHTARGHVHVGSGSERRPAMGKNGEIPTPLRDLIKDVQTAGIDIVFRSVLYA